MQLGAGASLDARRRRRHAAPAGRCDGRGPRPDDQRRRHHRAHDADPARALLGLLRRRRRRRHDDDPAGRRDDGVDGGVRPVREALRVRGDVTVTETGLGRPESTWGPRTVWENTGKITLVSGLFPTRRGRRGARGSINRGTIVKTGTGHDHDPPGVRQRRRGRHPGRAITATRFEQTPNGTLRFDIRGTATPLLGRADRDRVPVLRAARGVATRPATCPPAGQRFNVITAHLNAAAACSTRPPRLG